MPSNSRFCVCVRVIVCVRAHECVFVCAYMYVTVKCVYHSVPEYMHACICVVCV